MKRLRHCVLPSVLGLVLGITTQTRAVPVVELLVTPSSGMFNYTATVHNTGLIDLTLVSLVDAPPGDPLIGSSLVTPPGFLGLYDSGLGIIDFLEGTSLFGVGTTVSGFHFSSLLGTGTFFTTFEALDIEGGIFRGLIQVTGGGGTPPAVADSGSTMLLATLGLSALAFARCFRRRALESGRRIPTR